MCACVCVCVRAGACVCCLCRCVHTPVLCFFGAKVDESKSSNCKAALWFSSRNATITIGPLQNHPTSSQFLPTIKCFCKALARARIGTIQYIIRLMQYSNSFIHPDWRKRRPSAQNRDRKTQTKSIKMKMKMGEGDALHSVPVPRSNTSRIVPICRRFDFISCSVRSLVMPHSATSSARGDDISSMTSWNSGVLSSHSRINS